MTYSLADKIFKWICVLFNELFIELLTKWHNNLFVEQIIGWFNKQLIVWLTAWLIWIFTK